MRRYSKTGWVPKDERETAILNNVGLNGDTIKRILKNIIPRKTVAIASFDGVELKKVRVSVEVDVETL